MTTAFTAIRIVDRLIVGAELKDLADQAQFILYL